MIKFNFILLDIFLLFLRYIIKPLTYFITIIFVIMMGIFLLKISLSLLGI